MKIIFQALLFALLSTAIASQGFYGTSAKKFENSSFAIKYNLFNNGGGFRSDGDTSYSFSELATNDETLKIHIIANKSGNIEFSRAFSKPNSKFASFFTTHACQAVGMNCDAQSAKKYTDWLIQWARKGYQKYRFRAGKYVVTLEKSFMDENYVSQQIK